jgi:hypothetical protein
MFSTTMGQPPTISSCIIRPRRRGEPDMKSYTVIVVTVTVVSVTLSACTRKWAERPFIGTYHLVHPAGCREDIQGSTLVIREDGTYDQYIQLNSDRSEGVENGRWSYDRTSRRITFSKFLVSTETSFSTVASPPAAIIVNRSADCRYQHPK